MKIKGLLVMPGKEVQIAKIPASIKFIKSFIGAELFKIRLNDTTMIYTNKNAKIDFILDFIFLLEAQTS